MAKTNKAMWYIGFAGLLMAGFSWGFVHDAVINADD